LSSFAVPNGAAALFGRLGLGAHQTLAVSSVVLIGACLAGCGSSQSSRKDTTYLSYDENNELERYMLFEDGMVYRYRTTTAAGERGMMTIQVRLGGQGRVDLQVGGHTERLRIESGGIRYVDGGYFLKAPLVEDNSWDGRFGVVKITAIGQEASVPFGHFTGCIRTEEHSRGAMGAARTITSVFCPRVGLVSFEVQGEGKVREAAALEHYGPRIDPMINDVVTAKE
jgi:hypothetical protein